MGVTHNQTESKTGVAGTTTSTRPAHSCPASAGLFAFDTTLTLTFHLGAVSQIERGAFPGIL
jgi:hypothetical protein